LDVQRFNSSVGIDNNVKQQTTIIMIRENYTPQVYDVLYYLSDDDGNEMLDENGNVKLFTNPSGHIGGDCDLAEGIEAEDLEEINNKINQQ
jgi:hypothetical protein